MDPHVGRIARLLPGAAFLAYFLGTAILFFWGPWHYPTTKGNGPLIRFLLAANLAFALGYIAGIRGLPRASSLPGKVETLVLVAALLELLLLFPTSAFTTGRWVPDPVGAARDLGGQYSESLARRATGTPYVFYVRMFLAPVLTLAVPLGVFYWRALSWWTRGLLVASVIGTLALYAAMGANAGAGHWVAMFPWFVLAAHLAGVQRIRARGWIAIAIVLIGSVALAVILFGATMVERRGSFAYHGYLPLLGAYLGDAPPTLADQAAYRPHQSIANRSLARIGWDGFAGYVTQGYFAVYLSLQHPFVPCYGVGNSMFLQRQLARITGDESILQCAYPVRIDKSGLYATQYWTTAYPWIASDVTFPGTVLVLAAIGWLSGLVWIDVLGGRNPFAVALFGQLLVLLYYIPAHNKIMQTGEGILAFSVLLVTWLVSRRTVASRRL